MLITLKNLAEATEQQVFDQVVQHLLKQDAKSMTTTGHIYCCYKSPHGFRCAAGCLIADDEYDPSFEKRRWDDLVESKCVPTAHATLISRLQQIHDNWPEVLWHLELGKLAMRYKLQLDPAVPLTKQPTT